jgi:protein-tyrosine-phosphatase
MILFLCSFGGAKSVMAASWFNRLAAERGVEEQARAAAAETPYDAVPPPVVELLGNEAIDVSAFRPRAVTREDLETAARVVSIDCDLSALDLTGVAVERWDDVPKVSDGVEASAAAIRGHVEELVERLRAAG